MSSESADNLDEERVVGVDNARSDRAEVRSAKPNARSSSDAVSENMAHLNVPTSRQAVTITAEDMQQTMERVLDAELELTSDRLHPVIEHRIAVCPDCWMLQEAGTVPDDQGVLCRDAYSLRLVICPRLHPWVSDDIHKAYLLPVEWAPFRKRGIEYETSLLARCSETMGQAGSRCILWPGHAGPHRA